MGEFVAHSAKHSLQTLCPSRVEGVGSCRTIFLDGLVAGRQLPETVSHSCIHKWGCIKAPY